MSDETPHGGQARPHAVDPGQDDSVTIVDGSGRRFVLSREEWRTGGLPGALKMHWNEPDSLYDLIVAAMRMGFYQEVLAASGRLHETDPNHPRAVCVHSLCLTLCGQLPEAERVLQAYLLAKGEEAYVLINLAEVHAAMGDDERAEEALWRAVRLGRNVDAEDWLVELHRDRDGDEGAERARERINALWDGDPRAEGATG